MIANLAGFESNNNPVCSDLAPTFVSLPTGGPGGPVLTSLGNQARIVAKIDAAATALLGGGTWIVATNHSGIVGGSNVPWFPAPGPISGSTGNTGGAVIPIPQLATLIGIKLYTSAASLNAAGTAISPLANSGHSHTNGHSVRFFP